MTERNIYLNRREVRDIRNGRLVEAHMTLAYVDVPWPDAITWSSNVRNAL
jgi:hypothetical protein